MDEYDEYQIEEDYPVGTPRTVLVGWVITGLLAAAMVGGLLIVFLSRQDSANGQPQASVSFSKPEKIIGGEPAPKKKIGGHGHPTWQRKRNCSSS